MIRHTDSYKDLKVCCYAISADEPEEIIDRWLENVKPADYISVLITKTNNPNFAYFKEKQKLPEFKDKLIVAEEDIIPWRFDTARNESMKLIPKDADILISTDIDEVLIPDFWDDYRKCAFENPDFTMAYYKYAGYGDANNSADIACWYCKASPNDGHSYWRFPIHEELRYEPERIYYLDTNKVYLIHYQNKVRDRSQYDELSVLRSQEDDGIDFADRRVKECLSNGKFEESIVRGAYLYSRVMTNPELLQDGEYFVHSLCSVMGLSYQKLGMTKEAEFFYKQGLKANDRCRDCYICLAQLYADEGRATECFNLLGEMDKKVVNRPDWKFYLFMWSEWKLCQILGDAFFHTGRYQEAATLFEMGMKHINSFNSNDAGWCGFFDDYNACMKKLDEERNSSNSINGG